MLDYIQRNAKHIRTVERYPDVRRRSVIELGRALQLPARRTRSRSRAWRSRCSTRRARGTASATASASGSSTPRCCTTSARTSATTRHHKHSYYLIQHGDLRGFDPEEDRRSSRLVARYHRQATPKKTHEGFGDAAARRCGARSGCSARSCGWPRASTAATPRSIPASGGRGRRGPDRSSACGRRATPSWNSGPPTATPRRWPSCSMTDSLRARRRRAAPHKDTTSHARTHCTHRTRIPAGCSSSRASTARARRTQLGLLAKWLTASGHRVFVTEWNSSALVKAATKAGKKKNALTPMTFSLLHATDFADRLLYKIIPPLKAGMIVLADRYAYTAFARDVARGVDRHGCATSTASPCGRIWRSTSACRSTSRSTGCWPGA